MRDEDALQDAWVALLERGGPSTVTTPAAWLATTARYMRIHGVRAELRELAAWCEKEGYLNCEWYEEHVARLHARRVANPKYPRAKTEAERIERRRATWRESKRRARQREAA